MPVASETGLASVGRRLVERLGGRWIGRGGLCRCPAHDDHSPSLSIRLGSYGLLYHCFAGCDVRDVLREIRRLDHRALATGQMQAPSTHEPETRMLGRLRSLWDEAVPVLGSPAERYLTSRRLHPPAAGLRFHARVPLGRRAALRFRPAMLGAVCEGQQLVALQRTFLTVDGSALAGDLHPARRMLGLPGRGLLRLCRASKRLGLAEGIETAMSAMRYLDLPVWATLGAKRIPFVEIPFGVRCLVILADDDVAGRRAAARAAEAHAAPGRSIIRWWPGRGHNDWNDRLLAEGEGVGDRVRHEA